VSSTASLPASPSAVPGGAPTASGVPAAPGRHRRSRRAPRERERERERERDRERERERSRDMAREREREREWELARFLLGPAGPGFPPPGLYRRRSPSPGPASPPTPFSPVPTVLDWGAGRPSTAASVSSSSLSSAPSASLSAALVYDPLPTVAYAPGGVRWGDAGGEGEECVTCLEPFDKSGEGAKVWLACGHGFHGGCVRAWARVCDRCPVCAERAVVVVGEVVDDEGAPG